MRYYENLAKISENRLPQRSYYIPENEGAYTLLNGTWRFHYYPLDIDVEETDEEFFRSFTPVMKILIIRISNTPIL